MWIALGITSGLPENAGNTKRQLGFGIEVTQLSIAGGYCSCRFSLLSIDGAIAEGRAKCQINAEHDTTLGALYRPLLRPAMPSSNERIGKKVVIAQATKTNEQHAGAIDARLEEKLGATQAVSVPAELAAHYQTLRSRWTQLTVGTACYIGGSAPDGRPEVEALKKAGRVDLLRNVLRGANPEGRFYAAEALAQLDELDAADRKVVATLRAERTKLRTCGGCKVDDQTFEDLLGDEDR